MKNSQPTASVNVIARAMSDVAGGAPMRALELLRRALDQSPNDYLLRAWYSFCLASVGDLKGAEMQARLALRGLMWLDADDVLSDGVSRAGFVRESLALWPDHERSRHDMPASCR